MMHCPLVAELRGMTDFHEGSLLVVSDNTDRGYHDSKLLTIGDLRVGVLERMIIVVYTYLIVCR